MKNLPGAVLTLSLLIFAICCQKGSFTPINGNGNNNNNNNNNSGNDTTKPSAVGVPTGPIVSKFIGPGGGSLTTADGRVEIDIPSGALPNGETITIQNISNSMESGIGEAYRFLPNGLKFPVPVTIKFNYADSDLVDSDPQALAIAYQDSLHFWRPINLTSLDTLGHSFSGKTNHFTDFGGLFIYQFKVVAGSYNRNKRELMVNKFVTVAPFYALATNVGFLYPFAKKNVPNTYVYTVNDIEGGNSTYGTLADATQANSGIVAGFITSSWAFTYTAPGKVPPDNNPVELLVDPFDAYIDYVDTSGKIVEHFIHAFHFRQKIKIVGPPLYRIDLVDWEDLGSGGTVNYYDSASVFVSIDPGATQYYQYTISQDSIMNFPPVAWPTTPTVGAGNCTYTWIPEPIGTVNITRASAQISPQAITSTGSLGEYLVNVSLDNTGAYSAWAKIQCKNATATVNKDAKPDYNLPIPFSVDISDTSFEVLLFGTVDKDHLRVKYVKDTK